MSSTTPPRTNLKNWLPILLGLGLLIVVIVLRRAWISDDALITFRTVDNFLNGYGLRWNVLERVQTFTHPLWMLLLSATTFVTGNLIISAMLLSMACLISLLTLLTRYAQSFSGAVLALTALMLSNAFVDYSTSGLENPLTFVLIVAFGTLFLRTSFDNRSLFFLSLIASFALVNRLDTALFYAPALLYAFLASKHKLKALVVMSIAQLPIILWEIFSISYYGFPFPNTYYAKIGIGIPDAELWQQGITYIRDSLFHDPITLTAIILAIGLTFFSIQRWRKSMLIIGTALYILYVIRVGGDFMSGRFLAAPLVMGAFLISQTRYDIENNHQRMIPLSLLIVMILLGLLSPLPTFQVGETTGVQRARSNGIADERIVWTKIGNNFLLQIRQPYTTRLTDSPTVWSPDNLVDGLAIGLQGIVSDQQTHILDRWAIGDPLLARLPARYDADWRVGHFTRERPAGYEQTLTSGYNQLADPDLAQYYDVLTLITRGNLWSRARWSAIWAMNTGQYDHLIDEMAYRYPQLTSLQEDQLVTIFTGDTDIRQTILSDRHNLCPSGIQLGRSGILLQLSDDRSPDLIDLQLGSQDYIISRHRIDFRLQGEVIHSLDYFGNNPRLLISVPDTVLQQGYDAIHILPRVLASHQDCINDMMFYNYTTMGETVSTEIDDLAQANDLILVQSSSLWEQGLADALTIDESATIYYLSVNNRRGLPRTQTRNPYDPQLQAEITETLASDNAVIIIQTEQNQPDSYPIIPTLMETTRIAQMQTINEGLPFEIIVQPYLPPQVGIPSQFGSVVTLIDWEVDQTTVSACDSISVESLWYKSTPFILDEILLNVGLVLVSDVGVAQVDALPAERSFNNWDIRQQYIDQRTLDIPCDTPAGEYNLAFTMYNYQNGIPVEIMQDPTAIGTQVVLATITVEP